MRKQLPKELRDSIEEWGRGIWEAGSQNMPPPVASEILGDLRRRIDPFVKKERLGVARTGLWFLERRLREE